MGLLILKCHNFNAYDCLIFTVDYANIGILLILSDFMGNKSRQVNSRKIE